MEAVESSPVGGKLEIGRPCVPASHGSWMATSPCRLQNSIRLIERIHLHLRRELAPAQSWVIGIAPNPEPDLTHVHDVRVPEK